MSEPECLREMRRHAKDASRVRILRDIMVAAVFIPECAPKGNVEIPVQLLQAVFRVLDRKEERIGNLLDELAKYDPLMQLVRSDDTPGDL